MSFTSSAAAVDAGSTVTLSWATANATRVKLSAPGRGALVDVTDAARVAAGTFDDTLPTEIDPGQLFAYELEVTGPGATLTRSLFVAIDGQPAITSFTAPKYARSGSDAGVTLAWATTQADGLSLATGGAEIYRANAGTVASGNVRLAVPSADTTFTLTATNSRGGSATKTVSIDVVGAPTVTLTATPASPMVGEDITLAWSGTDVRNVTITDAAGNVVFRGTDVTDTGTVPTAVRIAATTTWRISADNGVGDVTTASVTATPANPITLTRSPATGALRAGQPLTLSWTGGQTLYGIPHRNVTVRTTSTGFDDISTTGTEISFGSSYWEVAEINPMAFTAPFYGQLVGGRVFVTTNGYLSFTSASDINYSDLAIPTAKLEALSIAPCWDDNDLGSSGTVHWQVKPDGTGKVLIVQWTSNETASLDANTYQVKVHSNGQVDIEYQTFTGTSGHAGIQGRRANEGFALPVAPASGLGVTFFAPVTATADVGVWSEQPIVPFVEAGGQYLPLPFDVGTVLQPRDLTVGEAMVIPNPSVGANGQWFELYNSRDTSIDLTGWSFALPDAGSSAPLSGTLAARGVLVVGPSADPLLNDDAGVTLALTGFSTAGEDAGIVTLAAGGGALNAYVWADPAPAVAQISDVGPYRFSSDTSSNVPRPHTCAASVAYGSNGQLGTPGTAGDCGFGYVWQEIPGGYFDISATGTAGVTGSFDSSVFDVDLTPAPFPFFGSNRTVAHVSTNGFVSFGATASSTDSFSSSYPSTTDTNLLIAAFADDLNYNSSIPGSQVYWKRVGANVDPAAAAPHWIFQWHHYTHYSCSDDLNFQIKLFDDGKSEIHFARMASSACSTQYGSGVSSVTWVENATGTQALVINANSLTPGISPNSAFRISPR